MKLVTVKELSESISIKEPTLYLWAARGIIPHYKIGQLVRFKLEEVEEWLEGFRKEADKPEKKRIREKKHRKYPAITDSLGVDNIVRKAIDEVKGLKV